VNLGTSRDLVIYFEGGGECYDSLTCETLMTATGGPFQSAQLASTVSTFGGSIFDRTLAGNPFAAANFVFVPYCTGDEHGGNNVATYAVSGGSVQYHHAGRANFAEDLTRLSLVFAAPSKVIVIGSDSGGYGALFNYDSIRKTWPTVASYLIDDSGSPLEANVTPQSVWADQFSNWNIGALLNPICACQSAWSPALAAIAAKYPSDSMSLISFTEDTVLPSYYGITQSQFTTALNSLVTDVIAPTSNVKYYFVGTQGHVLLFNPATFNQGVNLVTWLAQQVGNSSSWTSQHP
jgi:Pectinacetylesterase